jgi:hypothetical protein
MTVSKKEPAQTATAPAANALHASDPTARPDKRAGDELADQDLDNVSGGPTAVERNHSPI